MTGRQVSVLAIRIFGLFVGVEGLRYLLQSLEFAFRGMPWGSGSGVLLTAAGLLAAAAIIWIGAGRLAAAATPGDAEDAGTGVTKLSMLGVCTVALTILGVFMLSRALVAAGWALAFWIQQAGLADGALVGGINWSTQIRSQLTWAAASLLVGLLLTFRASEISALLLRRSTPSDAGEPPAPQLPE